MKQPGRQKELSAAELEEFFQQLALFFKSGIPAWEGLALLGEETDEANSELLRELSAKVSDGSNLSAAFLQSGRFPSYAIDMVRMGERTGRMQEITEALRAYYAGRDTLARELRTSVVYPLSMTGMVLAVIVVLIVVVMPVFEQVFQQLGLAMNPFSLSLLKFGQAFRQSALVILIVTVALVAVFLFLRFTKKVDLRFCTLMIIHQSQKNGCNHRRRTVRIFDVADAGKRYLYFRCASFRRGT